MEDYGEREEWNGDTVSIPDADDEDAPQKSKYAMGDVDDLDDDMYDDDGATPGGTANGGGASNGHGGWHQQQAWGNSYGGYQQAPLQQQQVHSNWQQLQAQDKAGDDTGI